MKWGILYAAVAVLDPEAFSKGVLDATAYAQPE